MFSEQMNWRRVGSQMLCRVKAEWLWQERGRQAESQRPFKGRGGLRHRNGSIRLDSTTLGHDEASRMLLRPQKN